MSAVSTDVIHEPATPMMLVQMAVQQGADIDKLQKLMELQERWEANQARKAFVLAMAEFKKDPPTIIKDKQVAFGQTSYKHAELDQVCGVIGKALSKVGISHTWEVNQSDKNIRVTCVLTHSAGHSQSVSLESQADQSGGKNSIQAIASAVTYLERYTLLAATGVATGEGDDDGKQTEFVTTEQAMTLKALAQEVKANEAAFLKYAKADNFETIPATKYSEAVAMLEQKRRSA